MSKLDPNAKSKLSSTILPQESTKKNFIVPEKIKMGGKIATKVHTFALKANDQERIKALVAELQSNSQKKITSTDILRGLLIIGEEMEASTLMDAVKKSFME